MKLIATATVVVLLAWAIAPTEPGQTLTATYGPSGVSIAGDLPPDAPVRIASITKVFTAALVLTLVDDGSLNLNEPAATYLTGIPETITIRDLMNHQSGLPQYLTNAVTSKADNTEWSPDELWEIVTSQPLEPTTFAYRNSNYLALGLIVEAVTGQRYHETLRQRILRPLALTDTYLAHYEDGDSPVVGFTDQITGEPEPTLFDWTSIETAAWAAGGLVSTADDVAAFLGALTGVLSEDSIEEMLARPSGPGDFGIVGDDVIGHRGELPGYVTAARHDVTTGETTLAFTTNDISRRSSGRSRVSSRNGQSRQTHRGRETLTIRRGP